MTLIGEIVRLQVQTESLKVGPRTRRRYDLGGLRAVPALAIDDGGVWGITEDGERVMDVHHRDHPASKYRAADGNGLSLGFTAHYAAMRARFGAHLTDGAAAENIIVASDRAWRADDLGDDLVIATAAGNIHLCRVNAATPCVEFARFALDFPDEARPDRTVSEAVLFLDGGMRGFYATIKGGEARVAVGDQVSIGS